MCEEADKQRAKRRRGQEGRRADRRGLGGASVEERVEEVRKDFERQREEDVRGWVRRFEKMEMRMEDMERGLNSCYHKKARNGGAAPATSRRGERDPRQAKLRV